MNPLVVLRQRQEEMEKQAYTFPPGSWEEFQRRLGAYTEIQVMVNLLVEAQRKKEAEQ